MGLIRDLGGRLAQSFLNLDDLVLGRGLVAEGLSQLGLSGRSVAGTLVVGTNVATRTLHAGVQVGAKTARATAGALEGFVPGAGVARAVAERLDRRAAEASAAASLRAAHAVEMTNGEVPRSPLNQEPWRSKAVARGTSWGELAADTAVGALDALATLPLAAGLDLAMTLAATRTGRATIDSSLKGAGMLLDLLPGVGSSSDKLDAGELREALATVTASSGDAAARNVAGLAEAALRLSLGDTRKLRATLHDAIESMRLLADHDELSDLLPAVPLSSVLRRRARNVVDHAPVKLLEALERGPRGQAPAPGKVLSALFADAGSLRVFVTDYPLALTLMGTHATLASSAGMVDAGGVEAYVKDGGSESARNWTASQLEAYAGKAPDGPLFGPAIRAGQDAVFIYSAEVLSRKRALARVERLYGEDARERLEADVSLDLDVLRAKDGAERRRKVRERVESAEDDDALLRQCDHCRDQLASLEAFSGSILGYEPKKLARRRDALSTFLSLAGQHLALRDADRSARDELLAARKRFEQWTPQAGPEEGEMTNVILGVGTDQTLWTRETLESPWKQVPGSGAVIGVTVLEDGTLLGIGTGKDLCTRETLTGTWEPVPDSGSVIGVAVLQDGTLLGVGTDHFLYTRGTLTSSWKKVAKSGSVIAVTVLKDGTLLGIGTGHTLWTRKTLTGSWKQVPASGSVMGVTVLEDGAILGIGMDNSLFSRKTLTSTWEHIAGSGSVIAVSFARRIRR